jgi:hypothetical protein
MADRIRRMIPMRNRIKESEHTERRMIVGPMRNRIKESEHTERSYMSDDTDSGYETRRERRRPFSLFSRTRQLNRRNRDVKRRIDEALDY